MIAPTKDEDNEYPVADVFRPTLYAIVEAFRVGDFRLQQGIAGVDSVCASTATQIEDYINDYGETLAALPDESWNTSVSRWMNGYWDILVDLYTVQSGESDLALPARIFEQESGGYRIEIVGVYVP